MHKLLAHLHISKFILISNSFAALIALQYLKNHRETVIGNVFTSPEIYLGDGTLAKITRPIMWLITTLLAILPSNLKPRGQVDYASHIGSTDWDLWRNIADMRNTGLRAHFYSLRQSMIKGQVYNLENISVPTLIMHGERDTMVPMKNAMIMKEKIKNAEFQSIPNVDHNTVHNAVKNMSETIEKFIEKHKTSFVQ